MKPTQKQPAVTREDFDLIKNAHGVGMGHICSCVDRSETLIDRLLIERDEAIREVERLKESLRKLDEDEKYDHQFAQDALDLEKAYEAEKRRTAAYREVAISKLRFAMFGNQELSANVEQELKSGIDAEAQKLHSGGEKDFKSQQKGDSKNE